MSRESSSLSGSGISVLRHVHNLPYIHGSNVVLANPEDVAAGIGIVQTTGLSVTSRVQITPQPGRLQGRRQVQIQNLGPGQAYVGNIDVTTSNGVQISSGQILTLDALAFGDIYIVSNATSDVRILQLK